MIKIKKTHGFTLIELLVVMAIVASLLSIVLPRYIDQTDKAKEAALRENLSALRNVIDQYYGDTGHYPASLELLVEKKYIRNIPLDPITERYDTWQLIEQTQNNHTGIFDIKSTAEGNGIDGTAYTTW